MSTMALCLALGGVSYAAVKLPKNSVVSATIKNGQVKNKDLGKNAVTGAKIKAGGVGDSDVANGINGAKLTDGSVANTKLASGIDGAKLSDGSIAAGKLAAGVTTPADGSISSAKITDGAVGFNDLSGDLQSRAEGAYASMFLAGGTPAIDQPYNKNVTAVSQLGSGSYCVTVDWAAAGRTPVQAGTPVIVTTRSAGMIAHADVYNPVCDNNRVHINIETLAGAPANGWVHMLIP